MQANKIGIPEKYEVLVNDITQDLEIGFVVYLNMETLEIETHLKDNEEGYSDEPLNYKKWKKRLSFEPFDSSESFHIMETFAEQVSNEQEKNHLLYILNKSKPFSNFNRYIDQSILRDDWFEYKNIAFENKVREIIQHFLKK